MAIRLSHEDFDGLAGILAGHGEWQSTRGRIDFIADVFAGSLRRSDILGQLDLDGAPRATAVRTVDRLATFGQDEPGRESLGVLVNKVLAYIGSGSEADFLRDLLARYPFVSRPVATSGIDTWRGQETNQGVAEKIIGENTLRDVCMLEALLDASRGVARIVTPSCIGTGFLVANNLLMTNHHVIESADAASACAFEFNYQLDRRGRELPILTVKAANGGLFHTSPFAPKNANAEMLDYTIVQLAHVPENLAPLSLGTAAPKRHSRLAIIQHPGGHYKKISLQNNFVEYVDEHIVQYTTSTEPGSSGSPVINDEYHVVALHHAGGNLGEPATARHHLRNEGIRMSAILHELKKNAPDVYRRIME